MVTPTKAEAVFTEIFAENKWQGAVPSGPGSTLAVTALIRAQLANLFRERNIRTLCDAPCGDATWVTSISGDLDHYFGIDVVRSMIEAHQKKGLPNHTFIAADIIHASLPQADAILCRDCLVHLPLGDAQQALQNFRKSGAKWLITTTFPGWAENREAAMGTWRPLDLQKAPFELGDPDAVLRERAYNPADKYNTKALGVWAL